MCWPMKYFISFLLKICLIFSTDCMWKRKRKTERHIKYADKWRRGRETKLSENLTLNWFPNSCQQRIILTYTYKKGKKEKEERQILSSEIQLPNDDVRFNDSGSKSFKRSEINSGNIFFTLQWVSFICLVYSFNFLYCIYQEWWKLYVNI